MTSTLRFSLMACLSLVVLPVAYDAVGHSIGATVYSSISPLLYSSVATTTLGGAVAVYDHVKPQRISAAALEESDRFHSCIIDVEFEGAQKGKCCIKLNTEGIADSGAGASFMSGKLSDMLKYPRTATKGSCIYMADGSPMANTNEAARSTLKFPSSRVESPPQYRQWFKISSDAAPLIIGNDFWAANISHECTSH